eukprot:s3443_g3.t1
MIGFRDILELFFEVTSVVSDQLPVQSMGRHPSLPARRRDRSQLFDVQRLVTSHDWSAAERAHAKWFNTGRTSSDDLRASAGPLGSSFSSNRPVLGKITPLQIGTSCFFKLAGPV